MTGTGLTRGALGNIQSTRGVQRAQAASSAARMAGRGTLTAVKWAVPVTVAAAAGAGAVYGGVKADHWLDTRTGATDPPPDYGDTAADTPRAWATMIGTVIGGIAMTCFLIGRHEATGAARMGHSTGAAISGAAALTGAGMFGHNAMTAD